MEEARRINERRTIIKGGGRKGKEKEIVNGFDRRGTSFLAPLKRSTTNMVIINNII